MLKWALPLAALLVLPLALPSAAPVADEATVTQIEIDVGPGLARGLVGVPAGAPTALVLVLHGYGHQAESHRGHLLALAERGAFGVAMDYRGDPDGFPLAAGALDSCEAFLPLVAAHPHLPTYLYSVSMGTAVAALVFAQCPVFDWWVNNEGLSMLHETWAGAAALEGTGNPTAVNAKRGIEEECGGTPATAFPCYAARSPALRVDHLQIVCGSSWPSCRPLLGAYLAHGLNDGLVPYDQGREMVATLRAHGVPADFYTVVRGHPGGEGTTITGYAGHNVDGLAGHGTESDDADALTALSFGLLYDLVEGRLAPPADREIVVDRDAGAHALP